MRRGNREERLPPLLSSHRPPRAFYFFFSDDCYFYRDTQREPLRRRENQKNVLIKNHANLKCLACHADI